MICALCKKEYKKQVVEVFLFGEKICLHDDKILFLHAVGAMPIKNDSVTAKVVKSGKSKVEEKYIRNSEERGNSVVRSSDGLLRELENTTCEE
jgi:hypothetical protein